MLELSELTAYAWDTYHIQEQHKWAKFPGFSVLCHPDTGKWIALLIRVWDTVSFKERQSCDLKCGKEMRSRFSRPYLAPPARMHGRQWLNITFDERTEKNIVLRLFDEALRYARPQGYTVVIDHQQPNEASFQETLLPFSQSSYRPPQENLPQRIQQMRQLYEYGSTSAEARAQNFYRQAVFMKDYVDDLPWTGYFHCYYPTYHDLPPQQLRGYFTWRGKVRQGNFQPIAISAAYLYLYELLHGIGAESPEDSLAKMQQFEKGFLDAGLGDTRMRKNLHRWMLEFAVLQNLPPEMAQQLLDTELLAQDRALSILKAPHAHSDEDLLSALCHFGGKRLLHSPVISQYGDRGRHLFCAVWRTALARHHEHKKSLFVLCFGKRVRRPWYPLHNAVYSLRPPTAEERDYSLNDCRTYHCQNGAWKIEAYDPLYFHRDKIQALLNIADREFRRALKTGRSLKDKPMDTWALPYIVAAIEEDRHAQMEAAKPRITLATSDLARIRQDADRTRDSLLLDEDETQEEVLGAQEESCKPAERSGEQNMPDMPIDTVQKQILRALLQGKDVCDMLKNHHLLPSLVADSINEALFDEIGDTVLLCQDDQLSIVEDYAQDIRSLLGGKPHE